MHENNNKIIVIYCDHVFHHGCFVLCQCSVQCLHAEIILQYAPHILFSSYCSFGHVLVSSNENDYHHR